MTCVQEIGGAALEMRIRASFPKATTAEGLTILICSIRKARHCASKAGLLGMAPVALSGFRPISALVKKQVSGAIPAWPR